MRTEGGNGGEVVETSGLVVGREQVVVACGCCWHVAAAVTDALPWVVLAVFAVVRVVEVLGSRACKVAVAECGRKRIHRSG